jgi:ATP-dependent exoDNAse (exonuclease V) beta subunit
VTYTYDDSGQRRQSRDPNHSYIVQAPAGSGKTELLTQRMLGLLSRVENPEEVIAITFTRKAAAEMNHRLVTRLQAAMSEPVNELEPHEQVSRELALAALKNDQERGWNLIQQPSRLRIRTIDSLCSELARQLPILSGLGGGQQVAEDAEPLYRLAAARTMSAIEDNRDDLQADIIRLLDRYDNQYDRLVDLLTSMLSHREQWIGHLLAIRDGDGFDRSALENALKELVEAELQSTLELAVGEDLLCGLVPYIAYAAKNLPDELSQPLKSLHDACGNPETGPVTLAATAGSLPHWVTLATFLLTQKGSWRSRITKTEGFPALEKTSGEERALRQQMKDGFTELLSSLGDKEELLDRFKVVRLLPRPDYDDESWESLESLMRVLIRAFQEWKVVMSETGHADFSEIASRAIQALGTENQPSNLALRMDYRIEHLLVDEFQDTSMNQIRLLERLTAGWTPGDGRTLFLVGDPMQSIYRFRKAEVSLFIQAFEGGLFQHISLKPLQLRVNFRSTQPVLDWVNEVFPMVMPKASDPLEDAVHYSESYPRPGAGADGMVSMHIAAQRDDIEEAKRVIDIIGQGDKNETTAILVRSRNHASAILAQLDQLKTGDPRFRYQAIDFNPLAKTPAILDLASLTLALTQVADRLAWLAVLRSPFVGLDLSDLDALASADKQRIIPDALQDLLKSQPGEPSALTHAGIRRLLRAAPVLLGALQERGRISIRTRVQATWTRLGGPACVNNESELDDASTFFDLLDTLETENLPIDRDTLELRLDKLYAQPDSTASGRLQVMTMYAAKGLQFDTVILPGLNRSTGNDKGRLLHWFELAGQDQIVMSPMRNAQEKERQKHEGDLIQFIADVEKRRQSLENGRLLYVAATRAKHSLFLLGAIEPTSKGEINPKNGTLLGELWPAIKQDQVLRLEAALCESRDSGQSKPAENPDVPSSQPAPQYRRLATDWVSPPPPDAVEQPGHEPVDIHDDIEFSWAGEDARLTGNLVHRLLQLIAERGYSNWTTTGGMAGRENWCRQQLASNGVTGDKADLILQRTSKSVENCLASKQGKWILEPREDSACEYALTAMLDGQARNLVLDRTFVEQDERWIIDYKTSSHSGGDPDGFLQNEKERYAGQLERYRQAMAMTETRPIRIALYFPLLDRFLEL